MKIAIIGKGYLGTAYSKVFPEAVIYDEPKGIGSKKEVNSADLAIVAVPTDLKNGGLDCQIVEEVVSWLETPLILIKSALMPGTVDRLVKKYKKKIAVSVEFIGMGNYYLDPSKYPDPKDPAKHKLIIVGGELETATRCAEILWSKMSPDTRIHLLTAKEAEIVKLLENAYGALKVTWANCVRDLVEKSGGNHIRVHQAWSEDGRVDKMHTRASGKGWKSHCWDKDIPALQKYATDIKAWDLVKLLETVLLVNEDQNDS